jgi:hypothetical protein
VNARDMAPVLIVGGYGSLGSRIARMLRRLHPRLPIAIAGRNPDKANAMAREIGEAVAIEADVSMHGLGLPAGAQYSAVVAAARDLSLHGMRVAQRASIPYLALSDAPFELGPVTARFVHAPHSSPVVLLGHAIGSVPTLAALHYAKGFESVERIDLGLVLDPEDPYGPMSAVDMEHIAADGPPPLLRMDGVWQWGDAEPGGRSFVGAGGVRHQGEAVGLLDVLSLARAAPHGSVRVDVAQGITRSRRAGGPPSHEVVVEITGRKPGMGTDRYRYELVDTEGYAALSARGISVVIESVLGLAGKAAPPGLYLPESLVDTSHFMERMALFGVTVTPDARA